MGDNGFEKPWACLKMFETRLNRYTDDLSEC